MMIIFLYLWWFEVVLSHLPPLYGIACSISDDELYVLGGRRDKNQWPVNQQVYHLNLTERFQTVDNNLVPWQKLTPKDYIPPSPHSSISTDGTTIYYSTMEPTSDQVQVYGYSNRTTRKVGLPLSGWGRDNHNPNIEYVGNLLMNYPTTNLLFYGASNDIRDVTQYRRLTHGSLSSLINHPSHDPTWNPSSSLLTWDSYQFDGSIISNRVIAVFNSIVYLYDVDKETTTSTTGDGKRKTKIISVDLITRRWSDLDITGSSPVYSPSFQFTQSNEMVYFIDGESYDTEDLHHLCCIFVLDLNRRTWSHQHVNGFVSYTEGCLVTYKSHLIHVGGRKGHQVTNSIQVVGTKSFKLFSTFPLTKDTSIPDPPTNPNNIPTHDPLFFILFSIAGAILLIIIITIILYYFKRRHQRIPPPPILTDPIWCHPTTSLANTLFPLPSSPTTSSDSHYPTTTTNFDLMDHLPDQSWSDPKSTFPSPAYLTSKFNTKATLPHPPPSPISPVWSLPQYPYPPSSSSSPSSPAWSNPSSNHHHQSNL